MYLVSRAWVRFFTDLHVSGLPGLSKGFYWSTCIWSPGLELGFLLIYMYLVSRAWVRFFTDIHVSGLPGLSKVFYWYTCTYRMNICCAQCHFHHLLRSMPFSSSAALMPVSSSAALNAIFIICCAHASFIICCAQCHFQHLLRSMLVSSSAARNNIFIFKHFCSAISVHHLITSTAALKLRLSKKACFHGTVTNRCVHIDHSPVKLHASPDIINSHNYRFP